MSANPKDTTIPEPSYEKHFAFPDGLRTESIGYQRSYDCDGVTIAVFPADQNPSNGLVGLSGTAAPEGRPMFGHINLPYDETVMRELSHFFGQVADEIKEQIELKMLRSLG